MMKRNVFFLAFCLMGLTAFAQQPSDPHWNVNPNPYSSNMTVLGYISLDSIEQQSTEWEVGAFCGTECRGVGNPMYCAPVNRYLLPLIVYGESGEEIHFKLYDSAQSEEIEATTTVVFQEDGYGTISQPLQLSFNHETPEPPTPTTYTQHFEILTGWNWLSIPLELGDSNGLETLKTFLGSAALIIKNNTSYLSYNHGVWNGSLSAINNESMYMINATANVSFDWTDIPAEASQHPIQINNGWNWISFLGTETMSLQEAFSNYQPNVGDMIKSNVGYASYTQHGWDGSLTVLTPGKGYMYLNVGSNATLVYPENH